VYCENGSIDASRVAKAYGGGGHKGAAGFIVEDIRPFLDNE
jgi:nanoRNase/pAp phosphatase (c-di-AMP/oligoRNAs hydrolase)